MLGHDSKNARLARRVCLLASVLVAALAYPVGGLRAQDPSILMPDEPVRLSADRVTTWEDADGSHWVMLQGNAAVLQSSDGIRADVIAVHVDQVKRSGQIGNEVQAYAEGHARTTVPDARQSSTRKTTLYTARNPKLTAFTPGGIVHRKDAPANLAILDRGFADRLKVTKAPELAKAPATSKPEKTPELAKAPLISKPPKATQVVEHEATLGTPIAGEQLIEAPPDAKPKVDPQIVRAKADTPMVDPDIRRAQDDGDEVGSPPILVPQDDPSMIQSPDDEPIRGGDDVPDIEPLPDVPVVGPGAVIPAPLLPNSRRTFTVSGGPGFQVNQYETEAGDMTFVLRGGVTLVMDMPKNNVAKAAPGGKAPPAYKTVDLVADQMVIWTKRKQKNANTPMSPVTGVQQDPDEPLQIYMEGNVRIRQDDRDVAGRGDEKVFEAEQAYYDVRMERLLALKGRVYTTTPGQISPLRTDGEVINQYREFRGYGPDGKAILGPQFIRVDTTSTTGSRFPVPGYRFDSRTLEIEDLTVPLVDQTTGGRVGNGKSPQTQDKLYQFRAFNSFYYLGPIPVFYLPYTSFTSDFDPILRNMRFQAGNVFGQTAQFDLSGFRLFGIKKPKFMDNWNIDVDYMSYRGLALGTELGWFGRDLVGDIMDPYNKTPLARDVDKPYFGYLELWGLRDGSRDILGPGPAIVTNGPPGAGKKGYQRTSDPSFQQYRGRATIRHMQRLLGDDAPDEEDFRIQFEASYLSDRNFLEEYYKRLFDSGLDQETLIYGIKQTENRAFTLTTEANLQNWYTDTQWLPKAEYTRLGDSLLNDWVNFSMRSGVDYANTHTASEVDNKNIFAFLPRDPVSNTSGPLRTGRAYTAAEIDVPINISALKIVPYFQGQVVGWDNQLGGAPVGRAWGAFGIKANIMAWRTFEGPEFESELLNVHSLAHKMNFLVDFRSAYSNVSLARIGVQDDLDDNTYEYARRYFTLTNYVGGLLPPQYDPRLLTLRRIVSPITGTTDIQDTIQSVKFGWHQRLQTKRGPDGKRRIVDYMVLDFDSTYFPNANRDNFGKPFGQNTYNYEWYLGDRTSFVSYGWFEFWKVQGQTITATNPTHTNDPFGLNVITSGFSINRPPRGSVFIGYSIINTGPISTSALNFSYTYWLSPKWYTYVATSYDFGNAILLGTTFSITKITKDYLTSVGLTVDPQRMNYQFAFEISPRFSPNVRFGSTAGQRFDSRFAPSQ